MEPMPTTPAPAAGDPARTPEIPPDARDVSVSMERANVVALLLMPVVALLLLGPFAAVYGVRAVGAGLAEVFSLGVFIPAFLVAILVHEGLHGLGFLLVGGAPRAAIHFGLHRATLSPFAGCSVPLTVRAYRWSVALPALILALLPWSMGMIGGWGWAAVWGAFMMITAAGDLIVVYTIRALAPSAMVVDHPSRVGCLVLPQPADGEREARSGGALPMVLLPLALSALVGASATPLAAAPHPAGLTAPAPPARDADTVTIRSDTTSAAAADSAARPRPLPLELRLIAGASIHALSAPVRWGPRDWGRVASAAALVASVSAADEGGRDLVERIRSPGLSRVEAMIEPMGAQGSLLIVGGMLATGIARGDPRMRRTAAEALAASLVGGGIVTPTLQAAIGRPKPRAWEPAHSFHPFGGGRSLPSGHTTQAFAVASVIAAEYGRPIDVVAYGSAAVVGVSRMYRRSHFLSDVVGGAIVGTVVGRAVAAYGLRTAGEGDGRAGVRVTPVVAPGGAGLVLTRSF